LILLPLLLEIHLFRLHLCRLCLRENIQYAICDVGITRECPQGVNFRSRRFQASRRRAYLKAYAIRGADAGAVYPAGKMESGKKEKKERMARLLINRRSKSKSLGTSRH